MSASALKDLNISQPADLEKGKDSSVKPCTNRPVSNGNKCVNKEENAPPGCPDAVTNGNEAAIVDVEYIDSENLIDLPDVDATLSTLVKRLDSKDWVMTCEALNNVRQLAKYHKERLQELLEPLVPLIVKSVKNPRSAVCKTALMTCADVFKAYGDLMVDSIDLLDVDGIKEYGMDKLIQVAATQLSDQLPESREAARSLALELQAFYEKSQASTSGENDGTLSESPDAESWEAFCQSKLSALSAQAILRVTSTPKDSVAATPKEAVVLVASTRS
ncbi:hypothetical protein PR202_ga21630 [Eleusine coracana subsp. coracana]|uniref:TOG domain-containing protein n=1 Tax=Eleusine coracana subsp. coracana TaxID=191504 RepID=A0AAV5D048_ELECO|nr:hypothetical protein PR202_ga21630 [Eleusine coracana subsp. coracana]